MTEWESVNVARGTYYSWGNESGQQVTGKVISFDPSGDRDLQGNPVPALSVELTENSVSIKAQKGERTELEVGTTIRLTASQGDLKAALIKAHPNPGDLVQIGLASVVTTKNGNTAKNFAVKIARGAAPVAPAPQPVQQAAFAAPVSDPWSASAPF